MSPAVASLPLSFSTIALALGMLIAGTVSETLGRRQVMTVALFLTSLLAVATLFSHSFESLLMLRLLQGLVLAGVPSVAMAYLGEEMDAQAIGHAMGLYISGNALGGMTGRIGSALLCRYVPWHSAVALIGVVSLLLSLVFLKSLPPSTNFHQRPFRAALPVHVAAAAPARSRPALPVRAGLPFDRGGSSRSTTTSVSACWPPPYNLETLPGQPDLSRLSARLVQLGGRRLPDSPFRPPLHDPADPFGHAGGDSHHLIRIAPPDCRRGGGFYLRFLQRPCHRVELGRQARPDGQGPGIVALPLLLLSRLKHFRHGGRGCSG